MIDSPCVGSGNTREVGSPLQVPKEETGWWKQQLKVGELEGGRAEMPTPALQRGGSPQQADAMAWLARVHLTGARAGRIGHPGSRPRGAV